ncbi:MAG TPA: permease-like cell division protein FtsX [Acidimicrobiales bacterium]|nr:permease-like cell division protein FtsX [Acidimicrobiales bacterium]
MPVSLDYVVRETGANLWRNRLMTIAAILTMAVSLALVGAALLLKQGAAKAEVVWQRQTQVTVWMEPAASKGEIAAVAEELKQLPYVRHPCSFKDKRQNYQLAQKLLTPEEWSVLSVGQMYTSFSCTPVQPTDAGAVIKRFTGQEGVHRVTAPLAQIHTQQKAIDLIQWIFLIVALVLLLSATVLILNTIRMAIFARRREVSVMKLVGATNWFIRIPFMSEGLMQGLLGSGVAALAVYALHLVFNQLGNPEHPQALFTLMRMSGWEVFWTEAVVVSVGVLIGSAGSALAIRRFLDV